MAMHPAFRRRLLAGEPLVGTFMRLPTAAAAEILGFAGFDFLVADLEHSSLTVADLETLIRGADVAGVPVMVRLPEARPSLVQQVLDAGAAGIQIAQVDSPDVLEAAVKAARYFPEGNRGLAFSHRAARYGMMSRSAYLADANGATVVAAQIESAEAVKRLPDLLAVPGVDLFFVGPSDLSQSLGHPGETDHPEVAAAMEQAVAAITGAGRIAGLYAGGPDAIPRWRPRGVSYFALGSDTGFLADRARDVIGTARGHLAAEGR